jgi:N-acylglucosamine-6-phosphate 2-epimerase
MDRPDIVAAMAQAVVAGGAVGVRIEGLANLRAARPMVDVPIIGIIKSESSDTPVRITVSKDDAVALVLAGADIVAYDATDRPRPDSRDEVLATILSHGAIPMADCSTLEDARHAVLGGATILGTTLSGYTAATAGLDGTPDMALIRDIQELGAFVMAEGRFDTPTLAAQAIEAGADCVTVGSALTRLEIMTSHFVAALQEGDQ